MDTTLNPTSFVLTNTTAITPDRVIDNATIVVTDGAIAAIIDGPSSDPNAIDCRGAYVAPGIVDVHSDGLEKEMRPRPGVVLPLDFAVRSFEGRVRAAGVTTMFHGIGFYNSDKYERTPEQAINMCRALEARGASGNALIDHQILHRLDVRDPLGYEALLERIDECDNPLISYEDHTPGVGQFANRVEYEKYIAGLKGISVEDAVPLVDELIEQRDLMLVNRDSAVNGLGDAANLGQIRLMVHDPATSDDIDEALKFGVKISEFPTTLEAAQRSRDEGLHIVAGGPNALRGISHSGNVSARELIAAGLCDTIASDYLPSTMLGAVGAMVHANLLDLVTAFGLITSGPADTVGMTDRGRLQVGQRGDLVVFDLDGPLPTVRMTISQAAAEMPPVITPVSVAEAGV